VAKEKTKKDGDDFLKKMVIAVFASWIIYAAINIAVDLWRGTALDPTLTTAIFGIGGSLELLICGAIQISKALTPKKAATKKKATSNEKSVAALLREAADQIESGEKSS